MLNSFHRVFWEFQTLKFASLSPKKLKGGKSIILVRLREGIITSLKDEATLKSSWEKSNTKYKSIGNRSFITWQSSDIIKNTRNLNVQDKNTWHGIILYFTEEVVRLYGAYPSPMNAKIRYINYDDLYFKDYGKTWGLISVK